MTKQLKDLSIPEVYLDSLQAKVLEEALGKIFEVRPSIHTLNKGFTQNGVSFLFSVNFKHYFEPRDVSSERYILVTIDDESCYRIIFDIEGDGAIQVEDWYAWEGGEESPIHMDTVTSFFQALVNEISHTPEL